MICTSDALDSHSATHNRVPPPLTIPCTVINETFARGEGHSKRLTDGRVENNA